jgi:transposase
MVAMESSGSYWKPIYNIFEEESVPVMVCNAQHIKNVPGRKTDVNDAQWIAKCLSLGLLKPSFTPDRTQRELRDMTRFRKALIRSRASNINRLQKFLEGANIKLSEHLSNIMGKSSMALLELILSEPEYSLEDVRSKMSGGLKSDASELFLAMESSMTELNKMLISEILRVIREQTAQIKRMNEMIRGAFPDEYRNAIAKLEQIPGIGEVSAEQIVVETGVDMTRFRNAKSFCSWAGVCPGNNESAGKNRSGKTPPGNVTLKTTLVQCAKSAAASKNSFFSTKYKRLVPHRGKNRATMAVAHAMLAAIYHVLLGEAFEDLGADYYSQFHKEKKINSCVRQLSRLGVVIPDEILLPQIERAVGLSAP